VQCPPPLGRVLLELVGGLLHHLVRSLGEILAQAGKRLPLLIDLPLEPFRVLPDLCRDLGHQLPLLRLDPLQLVVDAFLELLDVPSPVAEALLDGSLDGEQLVAEPQRRVALALRDVPPAFVGDAALLLGELRERIGAEPRQRPLQILRPLLEFPRDHGVELTLAQLDLLREHLLLAAHLVQDQHARKQGEQRDGRCRDGGDDGGGHAFIVGAPPQRRRRA